VADGRVLRRTQDVTLLGLERVPRQAVPAEREQGQRALARGTLDDDAAQEERASDAPLLGVPSQRDVGLALGPARLRRVLGAVEHVDLAHDGLGRDQVRVLRHVARAVHLARVVDRLGDLDPGLGRRVRADLCKREERKGERVSSTSRVGERGSRGRWGRTAALVIVLVEAEAGLGLGEVDLGDLEVVVVLARGVCREQEAVDRVVLVGGPAGRGRGVRTGSRCRRGGQRGEQDARLDVGEPLAGERGPVEGVGDDEVVQEERVLLPDLVLLRASVLESANGEPVQVRGRRGWEGRRRTSLMLL